jgi:hypothetical protein
MLVDGIMRQFSYVSFVVIPRSPRNLSVKAWAEQSKVSIRALVFNGAAYRDWNDRVLKT